LDTTLCDWILDFLKRRPQAVRIGNNPSSTLTLNTEALEGCILSPLLYSRFTSDCVALHDTNSVIKFADNTMAVGLITDNKKSAYREEVSELALWCHDNSLFLIVSKTKELIVEFGKQSKEHAPIQHQRACSREFQQF
jgi:hypothetical protein